jgi:hypothetical protein
MADKEQEPKAVVKSKIPRAKKVVTKQPNIDIKPIEDVSIKELKPAAKKKSKSNKSEVQENSKHARVKKSSITSEQQEPRRHLSVLDQNRGSRSSAGDLDD